MSRCVRVVVGARSAVFVAGLIAILRQQANISVVGGTSRSTDLIQVVNGEEPHVVVWDLEMGEVPHEISRIAAVLALIPDRTTEFLIKAVHAHVAGLTFRDTAPAVLAEAIRTVAADGGWVEPGLGAVLLRMAVGSATLAPPAFTDRLTERERDVLALAAIGMSASEIGSRLHLTDNGVKWHLGSLRRRFHARNTAHLIAIALRARILT
jgi:DNA-binding NarL/FixJ family response regulator